MVLNIYRWRLQADNGPMNGPGMCDGTDCPHCGERICRQAIARRRDPIYEPRWRRFVALRSYDTARHDPDIASLAVHTRGRGGKKAENVLNSYEAGSARYYTPRSSCPALCRDHKLLCRETKDVDGGSPAMTAVLPWGR